MYKTLYFPDILQNHDYDCGVVCVQAVLAYYGIEYRESKLEKILKTQKATGTSIKPIIRFFKEKGFKVKAGSFTMEDIKELIQKDIPVIILIQAWGPSGTDYNHTNQYGHYVVVSGFNKRGIIIEDPAIFGRGFISYAQLKNRWHAIDGELIQNFAIAIRGKKRYDYKKLYEIT
jgi:ABC-type bacteriocin/lantibiotic exporter with double-glycine peptidase domain